LDADQLSALEAMIPTARKRQQQLQQRGGSAYGWSTPDPSPT
jgi:hypothetical protein